MDVRIHRNNSFDLIRHFAALLVLFSHHFRLSGHEEPVIKGWDSFGFIAVAIFFTISGYFMPQSFARSDGFYNFMEKRCRRIFPGLIACSFFMVYIVGLYFTKDSFTSYVFSYSNIRDFLQHSIFIHNITPGLFSDFILKDAINGSLWTLPIEFLCYMIIGSCLSIYFCWKTIMLLLWFSSIAVATSLNVWQSFSFYGVDARYLAIFGVPFATGALLSMTKEVWEDKKVSLFILSLLIIFLTRVGPPVFVFGTAALSVITVIIGTSFKDKIIKGRFDLSYGIYIYAFPVQQIVINRVTSNFWLGMLISVFITSILAFLSYKYIEKPFLYKKNTA